MIQTIAQFAAAVLLAGIIFVTLSPLNLRPRTGFVGAERAVAYLLLAMATVVAFPDQFWFAALAVLIVALGLEIAQQLTPDRHGELIDAMQKVAGALVGCAIGYLINRFAALT
jgi:VanZ family protein